METKIVFLIGIIFAIVLFSGCDETSEDTTDNVAQCPTSLQQCGSGCIPQNGLCCDNGNINSYCLQPTSECGKGNCNSCPEGQAFCGMFCIEEGKQCCFGGDCPNNGQPNNPTQPVQPNITLVSTPKVICTFRKTETLWSPEMPWDGSYVCTGTVTFDFHGLTFTTDKTLKLYVENSQTDPTGDDFDEYEASANTPINQATFTYTAIGGDYFQRNKPDCPAKELNGLRLVEKIPDVENPFPKQEFDVTISAACG